tara:strand:- start:3442 stop:3717 length:276 start_codon:yes stop_codon:yes gene_type:complete
VAGYKKESFGSFAASIIANHKGGEAVSKMTAWRSRNGYSPTFGGGGDGNTRKAQPAHTAGPYRTQGASTTNGSSVGGVPGNSQPLKWNERL